MRCQQRDRERETKTNKKDTHKKSSQGAKFCVKANNNNNNGNHIVIVKNN